MPYYNSSDTEAYVDAGDAVGLELIGYAPMSVRDRARWRCVNCGRISDKSLRAVRKAKRGCTCSPAEGLIYRHEQLASRLGILWRSDISVPRTATDKTHWSPLGDKSVVVEASYNQLGYTNVSKRLKEQLKIS